MAGPGSPDPVTFRPGLPVGSYPYFAALSQHPNLLAAYSLRDHAQLLKYRQGPGKPPDVTYLPEQDTDPRRQDGAKIVTPKGLVSLGNNVILPIPEHAPKSLFAVFEFWMGAEYAYELTGIGNYKHFNFQSRSRIWTEIKADFNEVAGRPGELAAVELRYYGSKSNGEWGANVTHNNPVLPQLNTWTMRPETWTRYFVLFHPRPDLPATVTDDGQSYTGHWWEFSQWACDVGRPITQIHDKKLIVPNYPAPSNATGWHELNIEYNTSSKGKGAETPARVSYMRNVVFLKGITDVTPLLVEIEA